jgi:putative oxidoreductase
MSTSSKAYITLGRVLLGLYFLVPGIAKLLAPATQVALMEHHNIPNAGLLLMIAGVAQVLGALFLMGGRHVRKVALGFVLYILVINFLMHDFWHFTGMEATHELQNFIKNLGILAGLLVIAGHSPVRALQPKTLLRSDKHYTT